MLNIFFGVLRVTLGMSAVILLMMLMLRVTGKRFTVTCRYIIWAVVILRLAVPLSSEMIPVLFEISINIEDTDTDTVINDTDSVGENTGNVVDNSGFDTDYIINDNSSEVTDSGIVSHPQIDGDVIHTDTPVTSVPSGVIDAPVVPDVDFPELDAPEFDIPETNLTPAVPLVPEHSTDISTSTQSNYHISWENILYTVSILYLVGISGFIMFNLISYCLYVHKLASSSTVPNKRVVDIYMKVCEEKKLRRIPKLLSSGEIGSPVAFGIFRRKIFIPDISLDDSSIKSTLTHEVIHCKRGDLYVKILMLIARALHWFNPFVHIAAHQCETAMELSCDEALLKGCGEDERIAYGETMLDIVRSYRRNGGILTTHFNPRKNAVKARLVNIISGAGKSRGRIIISVSLLLCILAGALVACNVTLREETPATEFEYTENESGGITITDYVGERAEVVIPSEIEGKKVTEIGKEAFCEQKYDSLGYEIIHSGQKLTYVDIPDTVTFIDDHAFRGCNELKTVILSDSLEVIGVGAFTGCLTLEKIDLPVSLKEIRNDAFSSCSSLTEVRIMASVKYGCDVFKYSGIKIAEIEEGVTVIPSGTFSHTKLKNVNIPGSVKTIESFSFFFCENLSSVTLNNGLEKIYDCTFSGNSILREVIIPESVIELSDNAFDSCNNLLGVKFKGNAPQIVKTELVGEFGIGYTIYYYDGAEGFDSPDWSGYKTEKWVDTPKVPVESLNYKSESLNSKYILPMSSAWQLPLASDVEEGYYFVADTNPENEDSQILLYLINRKDNNVIEKKASYTEIIKQRWPDAFDIRLTYGTTSFSLPGKYESGVVHYTASHIITEDTVLLYDLVELSDYEPMKPFESNREDWWVEIDTEHDKLVSVNVKGASGSSFTYLAEEWGFEQYSEMCIDRQLIVHPTLNCALIMCQDKITENYLPPRSKALLISLENGEVIDAVSCGTQYSTENVEYPIDMKEFYWEINIAKENHVFGKTKYIFDSFAVPTEKGFEIQISITDYKNGKKIFPVYYKTQLDFFGESYIPRKEIKTLSIDGNEYILSSGDSDIANRVSKTSFTKSIEFTISGQKITIDAPIFTGLPVDKCYSYNDFYPCIDGSIIFKVGTDDGALYVKIDKNGKIIGTSRDSSEFTAGRDIKKYLPKNYREGNVQPESGGIFVGDEVKKKIIDGLSYLYSVNGECISTGYDSIGNFYYGVALVVSDNKIGMIDESGNEVLAPCIEYDTVLYPPKAKELGVIYMFEDAFVLPIGGEFAIINIHRTTSGLSEADAKNILKNAYSIWACFSITHFPIDQNAEPIIKNGIQYYPLKNYTTTDKLREYLHTSFSKEFTEEILSNALRYRYLEVDGRLYGVFADRGSRSDVRAKPELTVTVNGDGTATVIRHLIIYHDGYQPAVKAYADQILSLVYENDRWVFDNFFDSDDITSPEIKRTIVYVEHNTEGLLNSDYTKSPFFEIGDADQDFTETQIEFLISEIPEDQYEVYPSTQNVPTAALLYKNGEYILIDINDPRLIKLINFFNNAFYHNKCDHAQYNLDDTFIQENIVRDDFKLMLKYSSSPDETESKDIIITNYSSSVSFALVTNAVFDENGDLKNPSLADLYEPYPSVSTSLELFGF